MGKQQCHGIIYAWVCIENYFFGVRHLRGRFIWCHVQVSFNGLCSIPHKFEARAVALSNRFRITLTSFLAYFVMSGMLAPIGIISGPMAVAFDLPITEVTAYFSYLTVGIFVGAVLALFALSWLRIRTVLLGVYGVIAISLTALAFNGRLEFVAIVLGAVGVGCGVGLPAAALVIARTYAAEQRASMLVITDGSFSVAGVVCAWVAVTAIAQGLAWSTTYLFVGAIALALVVLASLSDYPDEAALADAEPPISSWPVSAWLCIAALCLYTLAQNTMLWWLPQYAQNQLGMRAASAGALVGQFWSGMFAAQIFVAWWVFRIGVSRLLGVAAVSTVLFSIPIWWVSDARWLWALAALWGFANLGLLKVVLSYGSQFTAVASPRLVSSLLLGATTGTAISPWVSSQMVAFGDAGTALRLGSVTYLVMVGLVALAVLLNRGRVKVG